MKKNLGNLCVRFVAEDLRCINKVSKKYGIGASTWVRKVALERLQDMNEKTSDVQIEDRDRKK